MEKRKNKSESVSKEFAKDHEEEKRRKAERSKSATRKNNKSRRKEFISWGSRSLIEFLASMGKDTSVTLSQHDVASIIENYIKEKKLFDPKNKKRITCDASLQSLFGKKIINKNRIYNLLESHFTENQDESEEDELGNDSEDNEGKTLVAYKRQRKQYSQKEGKEHGAPRIYFASITTDNIKLVYLKKSLLFELFGQPESFEEKVIGSFVRVKIEPYDYRQKISYRLVQVKGIKKDSAVENNTEIILQVSSLLKGDIPMSKISDYDFSEEECEDLRKRVMDGELARPTVVEFEQKARILHKDITKHWIRRELALLQNLIDQANEKGWRHKLFEYLGRRKRLQTPAEQSRLLENVPVVIVDLKSISNDREDDIKIDGSSSKSIFLHSSTVHNGGLEDNQTSESLETKDKMLKAPITMVYSRRRKSKINSHGPRIDSETEEKARDSEEPPCPQDTKVEV